MIDLMKGAADLKLGHGGFKGAGHRGRFSGISSLKAGVL